MHSAETIVVCTDQPSLAVRIKMGLERHYRVIIEGIAEALSHPAALYIIDAVTLDKNKATPLLEHKRTQSIFMPVLLVVAADKIASYGAQAASFDECITMPVNESELQMRVESLLHRRRLSREVADLTELRESEAKTRDDKESLRITLKSIADGVIATDTQGNVTRMNPKAEELTGWSMAAASNRKLEEIFHIVHARSRKKVINPIQQVLSTGEVAGLANHTLLISRNGQEHLIADSASPIKGESGSVSGVVLIFRDVTAEYIMREQIADNEERFRIISELVSNLAYCYRPLPDNQIELDWYFGPFEQVTGYTMEQLSVPEGLLSIIHSDDKEMFQKSGQWVSEVGTSQVNEFRIIAKSEKILTLRCYSITKRNRKGQLRFYFVLKDITEQKRAEEALKSKAYFLSVAQQIAGLGSWESDLKTGELTWSDELYRINHETRDTFIPTPQSVVMNKVHPDDRAIMMEWVEKCGAGEDAGVMQYRFFLPDGTLRYARATGKLIVDEKNNPVRIIGTAMDITEQKLAEQALRESEQRYRSFFESLPYALFFMQPDTLANPNESAIKMFGLSAPELEHIHPYQLSPPTQPDGSSSKEKAAFLIRNALAGQPQFFEWRHVRSNGEQFDAQVALIRVDIKGKTTILAHLVEITSRKKAERRLQTSLQEKETLLQEIYHRTKNNMQVISSFLQLQAASVQNDEVDRIVQESTSRIRTMALAHEKLYKSKSLSRIDLGEYIRDLASLSLAGGKVSSDRVGIHFNLDAIESLIDIAIPLGLIINELLSNAFKYAFPNERRGHITITLKRVEKKQLRLQVEDDGVGVPPGTDITKTSTMGVQLVLQIVKHQLSGRVQVDLTRGVRWTILFDEGIYFERVRSE